MISVREADITIAKHLRSFSTRLCSLRNAYGTVLRENILADRDFPPFHKALMDGIAIKSQAYLNGLRRFHIAGTQAAGMKPLALQSERHCVEIMTGAALTKGCDCIVPIEQVKIQKRVAFVKDKLALRGFQHICLQGADYTKRSLLLDRGRLLLPAQIAVIAAVGRTKIKVSAKPKVAIISTGDEIVGISRLPTIYQTRASNACFVKSALDSTHLFESKLFHFIDHKKILQKGLKTILRNFDVLIFSGGVSMGKFDFVPEVLKSLGIKVLFHKIRQKPGKPFWFGISKKRQPVFALPGNPVSTQVGVYRYVLPHLKRALGLAVKNEYAVLNRNYKTGTPFTFFLPVRLNSTSRGLLEAKPVSMRGSGDLATIGKTDGFVELPSGKKVFRKGFCAKVYRWTAI